MQRHSLRDSGLSHEWADSKAREFLTKWMNDKLSHRGMPPYNDCVDACSDGIGLAYLLEACFQEIDLTGPEVCWIPLPRALFGTLHCINNSPTDKNIRRRHEFLSSRKATA